MITNGADQTPGESNPSWHPSALFEKVCRDFQAQLVEMSGEAERVHLLMPSPPKHSVSSLVPSLKGVSSRLLHIERPDYRETLLEQCPVFAFLLRRQLWRGTAGHYYIEQYVEQEKTPL
jgi:putative transposase